jgi:hypothetical protein
MPVFQITFFLEPTIAGDPDIEITELVEAEDFDHAMELARKLRHELPEIDALKTTTWTIESKAP